MYIYIYCIKYIKY